jgi:hypothetical protein
VSKPRANNTAEIEAAFRRFGEEMARIAKEMRTNHAVNKSLAAYRKRDLEETSLGIHGLDRQERDLVYRWCAWMIGFGDDERDRDSG